MTIKSSGSPLSMSEINAEFARGNNLNAYRGTSWYTNAGASGLFNTTPIAYNEFYGKRLTSPVSAATTVFESNNTGERMRSFVVPNYNTIQIICEGVAGEDAGTGCEGSVRPGGQGARTTFTRALGATGAPVVGSTITIYNDTYDPYYGSAKAQRALLAGQFDVYAGAGTDGASSFMSGGRGASCSPGANGSSGYFTGGDAGTGFGGSSLASQGAGGLGKVTVIIS